MAVSPGLTGKGNLLLNKVVEKLHLAECGKLYTSQRQQHQRQLFKLRLHKPIILHCEQNDLQSVLQCDK